MTWLNLSDINIMNVNVCLMREISDKKILNSFVISKSNIDNFVMKKTSVSNHWKLKFHDQIQTLLIKHYHLFRKKLESFNDNVKMLIRFVNKKKIWNLKKNIVFTVVTWQNHHEHYFESHKWLEFHWENISEH